MAAITDAAKVEAEQYSDVSRSSPRDERRQPADQPDQTFINDKVDAIVPLPFDGAALTDAATKAIDAGIEVVNVDRECASPFAARSTVLGRQDYGILVLSGTVHLPNSSATSRTLSSPIAASTPCR